MKIKFKRKGNLMFFVVGVLAGISSAIFYFGNHDSYKNTIALRLGQEGFVNPLVACDSGDASISDHLSDLKNVLTKTLDDEKRKGLITRASVYFRNLNLGEWTGVNEDDLYDPASLKKVPLMIAYFKNSELDPAVLDKYLLLDKLRRDDNEREFFKPPTSLVSGNYYKVNDLIYRMIVYSGNNSYNMLFDNINKYLLSKVYTDLGTLPVNSLTQVLVSPKSYSTMWRSLFNASYLSREDSNHSLDILSKAEFKLGLSATIPVDIPIAHKFGERTIVADDGLVIYRQLHDCGIIYYPGHPYFVCVMTEGKDFDELETTIQNVSKETYEYMDSKYKK